MTFTHALSTNNYGPAKFIVSAAAAEGTHTTIAAALTSASSGDTIFIRPGSYTENLTLKAGVNLAAYTGDGATPNVTIIGKMTATFAGTASISNIYIQTNSDFILVVSGSAATIINLNFCTLNASNNTLISYTTSSASSQINVLNCISYLATTGIAIVASSSAGTIYFHRFQNFNTGSSLTASTVSAGQLNISRAAFSNPISVSGTAGFGMAYSQIDMGGLNAATLTVNVAGGSFQCEYCKFVSGTSSAVTATAGTVVLLDCIISSTNTNAVTGAGTVKYGNITFTDSSSTINTTTQTSFISKNGVSMSTLQPAFLAVTNGASAQDNVTGDGTDYTVLYPTEIFDQASNYASPTFTAPYTGRYYFFGSVGISGLTASHTSGNVYINTSNRLYVALAANLAAMRDPSNQEGLSGSCLADMDAADTASIRLEISNGTKVADVLVGATDQNHFGGCLLY